MDIVRYGIVGVGLMGIEHIRNLLAIPSAVVTAIADDYPESLENCRQILVNECQYHENVQQFTSAVSLAAANICDVIIVATPNHTHYQVLMDSYPVADDRVHFLVEKPLCTTLEHCREVLSNARSRTGITYVGLEYSYMPPVNRILRDARAGVVGSVRMCAIREHRFPFLKKVRNWNRFSANSGGTLVEKCCHFFDLFARVFEERAPVSVYASGAQDVNHLDECYDGRTPDILDNAYVVVNYEGGRRAMLDLCMFAEASKSQEEVAIVGAEGKMEAFLPQSEVRTGIRGKHGLDNVSVEKIEDSRIKYLGHHHGSSYLEHLDIIDMIKNYSAGKTIPTAGLYQGLMSVAIGVAAHMSIDEGRVVMMDEIVSAEELKAAMYKVE